MEQCSNEAKKVFLKIWEKSENFICTASNDQLGNMTQSDEEIKNILKELEDSDLITIEFYTVNKVMKRLIKV